MTNEAIGTWDDLFAKTSPAVQALAEVLRRRILDLHPSSVEVVRPGDGSVSFGHGPKKMSEAYVYLAPHTGRVNLGFYRGAYLADPSGKLEGTGKALRHIKVATRSLAESAEIESLIAQAIAERRQALG